MRSIASFVLVWAWSVGVTAAPSDELLPALAELELLAPRSAEQCTVDTQRAFERLAQSVDRAAAELGRVKPQLRLDATLSVVERLLLTQQRVDRLVAQIFAVRGEFAARREQPRSRDEIRHYLGISTAALDLSGRVRLQTADTLRTVVGHQARSTSQRQRLVEVLSKHNTSIGAEGVIDYLFDDAPPIGVPMREPALERLHSSVLKLIAASGATATIGDLAEFVENPRLVPELVIQTAETLRAIGLPQEARPGSGPDVPLPAIHAKPLLARLQQIPRAQVPADYLDRYDTITAWLGKVATLGLADHAYRVGLFEVQSGDWLLMRNPSPFNLFTDLAPGLYTHVGVVAEETLNDGSKRMVIVDLPERGRTMPATNVDAFLLRTLSYTFLRHPDATVAQAIGAAARDTIGNPIEFDLNFRTARVDALRGQPLRGQKVQTYCAGLLYLCALQTTKPRHDFFPIHEQFAPGLTADNVKRFGMSLGDDFVSPTGALFSPVLQVVGRNEPLYDSRREVEEGIFDYFAQQMRVAPLDVAPDAAQDLKLKLAEASKSNPLLAAALARAADVSDELDLVAAAKASALIDALDQVAFGASGQFNEAVDALSALSVAEQRRAGVSAEVISRREKYLQLFGELHQRLITGQIDYRQLHHELVLHYLRVGKQQIDQRFFAR